MDLEEARAFFQRVLDRCRSLPGVERVGVITNLPASNIPSPTTTFTLESRPAPRPSEMPRADLQTVSSETLQLFRVPLLEGRYLSPKDSVVSTRVVVVSESLASSYWPNGNQLGQRIRIGDPGDNAAQRWWTVVGVVTDVRQNWFDPTPRATIYASLNQLPGRGLTVTIRSGGDPDSLAAPLRALVAELDPQQAVGDLQPMTQVIDESMAPIRIIATLTSVFGALSLLLAGAGIYGIVAIHVAQRTHEFGLRMALGARSTDLVKQVVSQTLRVALVGIAAGLPLTLVLNVVLAKYLFGLVDLSLTTLITLTVMLVVAAVGAALGPSLRAARLDPALALRTD